MRLVTLAVLVVMLSSGTGLACSCSDLTPRSCNLLSSHDVSIFIGTVVSVENPPKKGDDRGGVARYHFRVDEWLSPDVRGEVDVLSGRGGADCSFWFESGVPYLVFAYRGTNGELGASACSNTQRVEGAGALLTQLRAMRNGQPVARVYGTLRQVQQPYAATYQPDFDKPLPQAVVHFESPKRKVTAKTAEDGTFAVYELPSDNYKITADLAADLELAQTILSDPPAPLELDNSSCVERDIDALPTSKIRGRLLASDGKPLWNTSVELFSVDRYKEGERGWWEFVDDKKKYFEFEHVTPGEYVLVFNPDNRLDTDVPYPRTFFRDAPDLMRAEHIHVGAGEQLLHADLQLKGSTPTRRITIRVTFAGGGEPTSSYLLVKGSKGEQAFPSPLEENLYELNVIPESQYTVMAHTNFCDPETESSPITFLGASAAPELTITVPETKCSELPQELKRRDSK